jgi:branched-chain amino acid transport system ATP-binding protein
MAGLLPHANKVSGTLSLGDQKVLELAIVLAAEPKLLLLDEPTAGMASYERMELMNLVTRIVSEKQITVLFIEHDMDVVFSIAQRISVMHQGKIIAEDSPGKIKANEMVQGVYLGWQR